MRLNLWLAAKGISDQAFADKIGTTRQAVHRYKTGARHPEASVRAAIFVATDGDVTPNDFDGDLSALKRAS